MASMEIFKDYNLDNKPFKHPLQNPCFRYYLVHINRSYDFTKLCNDYSYLQNAYNDYFNHLIDECHRPKYPPDIKVEDYAQSFVNAFTVYRRYLSKYLEELEIKLPQFELVSLAHRLWDSESQDVISHYEKLSIQLKIIYDEQLKKFLQNDFENIDYNHKQSHDEGANSSSQDNEHQHIDDLDFDFYIDFSTLVN